jgi:hypothetical protein
MADGLQNAPEQAVWGVEDQSRRGRGRDRLGTGRQQRYPVPPCARELSDPQLR